MTRIETVMPIDWNSIVIHIYVFHTVEILCKLGPFSTANTLDIERLHTVFKKLARGRKNVLASIANHYALMETAMVARLKADQEWSFPAAKSSFPGHAARADSEDKADRHCEALGGSKVERLTDTEFQQVQTLWADHYPEYAELHRKFRRYRGRARDISEWVPGNFRNLTDEERRSLRVWQQMSPQIKVLYLEVHTNILLQYVSCFFGYIILMLYGACWCGMEHTF